MSAHAFDVPVDEVVSVKSGPHEVLGALWLAAADLRFRLRRFVVAVVAASCILALLLLMTGVVNQFDREPGLTVRGLAATHWVLPAGIENPFTSNAVFSPDAYPEVAAEGGVNPVVLARLPITANGETIDAVLVGHPASGPGAPDPSDGRLATGRAGIAISSSIEAGIGEAVLLGGESVEVVGRVSGSTLFAGMPVVYVPIEAARERLADGLPFANALLTMAPPSAVPPDLHVVSAEDVIAAAKGPVERPILSLHIVRGLLALVAAMIIGAVVYLASIERTRDVAVFRAVGTKGSMLAVGVAAQALAIALVAALGAVVLQAVISPVFPLEVYLSGTDLLLSPVTASLIAMAASYAAIRRTLRIDPSAAFSSTGVLT